LFCAQSRADEGVVYFMDTKERGVGEKNLVLRTHLNSVREKGARVIGGRNGPTKPSSNTSLKRKGQRRILNRVERKT